MHKRHVIVLLLLVAISVTLMPVRRVSAATTWTVRAGSSRDNGALQALRFLPKDVTVTAGDTVQWAVGAADHTIYFPAGQKAPDLIVPGKNKGELVWNPAVFFASPQKTYDGSGPVSGGVLSSVVPQMPRTYAVTFAKAGTYPYVCLFHPGMEGTITVQAGGTAAPKTQADYDKTAAQEAREALDKAAELMKANTPIVSGAPGKRTFTLNLVGSKEHAVSPYRFPVDRLEIRRGETVTWAMKDPTELHTVTFGAKKGFDIVTMKPQPQGPPVLMVNMQSMAPTPGKEHRGPGFYNSGFMLTEGPGARSYTLKFTRAGTYNYDCTTHVLFGMKASIVVK